MLASAIATLIIDEYIIGRLGCGCPFCHNGIAASAAYPRLQSPRSSSRSDIQVDDRRVKGATGHCYSRWTNHRPSAAEENPPPPSDSTWGDRCSSHRRRRRRLCRPPPAATDVATLALSDSAPPAAFLFLGAFGDSSKERAVLSRSSSTIATTRCGW